METKKFQFLLGLPLSGPLEKVDIYFSKIDQEIFKIDTKNGQISSVQLVMYEVWSLGFILGIVFHLKLFDKLQIEILENPVSADKTFIERFQWTWYNTLWITQDKSKLEVCIEVYTV